MRRLVLILLLAAPLAAEETTSLFAAPASQLVLEGSSNVAPWRCQGASFDARMDVAAPLPRINHIIDRIEDGNVVPLMADPSSARFPQPAFRLRVPVTSLRCGNAKMERDLSRALRAAEFPSIEFRFTELIGGIEHDIDAGRYRAKIAGVLSLAGTARNIRLDVEAQRVAPNRFRLRARLPMKMTDFQITPPTALFGAIKARNELAVRFDLILQTAGAK
ncbi:MAG TPA: YceI family protein [Thermoanaerobaculia bacterium]|nr:YceI family protein [Thermoanaerobaculia bacterium]